MNGARLTLYRARMALATPRFHLLPEWALYRICLAYNRIACMFLGHEPCGCRECRCEGVRCVWCSKELS